MKREKDLFTRLTRMMCLRTPFVYVSSSVGSSFAGTRTLSMQVYFRKGYEWVIHQNSERDGNTRNLYAGQEATVRTGHGTTDWFQIGKGVCQGCILSPYLFNFYAEYIMRNSGLEEHKLESRLPGEISITSDMQMTPPLWHKVKRN